VLDGSAHAQFIFETEHAGCVMREIVRFCPSREQRGRPWRNKASMGRGASGLMHSRGTTSG